MQAIKEKLNDLSAMRKAKAEAREEEKAEKELAKARVEVAHEVRMAKEAEAAMDLHVHKAVEKAAEHERKQHHGGGSGGSGNNNRRDIYDSGSENGSALDPYAQWRN
ncbi:hypothetical protein ABFS82_14G170400 [Erythranthe guttata]